MNQKNTGEEGLRSFEGAVSVVTGGASGIGAALARELHRQGSFVVIADRQIKAARACCEELSADGPKAEAVDLDVRQQEIMQPMVDAILERYGRLDYFFNNAGIGIGGEVLDHRADDWKYVIDVNLLGVAYGVQAAYPHMVKQGFGHIVNTSSLAGLMPTPQMASYSAAKHGVVGLTRSLRAEARDYGVRVTTLCPGVVRTPILLSGGRYGRMRTDIDERVQVALWNIFRPMDATQFAKKVLRKLKSNPETLIVPGWWRLIWWLNRLSPSLASYLTVLHNRQFKKTIRNASGSASDQSEVDGEEKTSPVDA